ncbi:hypothetical protein [Neptunomonas phycophila]|uniref:hypothetical protein n=1 Tax=Neptunomonas phycophila TaxID=1572645 RepID=UPI001BE9F061|nr:hypothetical protein [Neptunomonas phycophila]MBT3147435.1 hypothetical protein [Neptunomonas phycophila]
MREKYLNTFWLAPLIPFIIFVLVVASAMAQLFPAPYYLNRAWEIAVVLQAVVVAYQFGSKQFKTGSISALLLFVPVGCWLLLAIQ